MRGVIISVVFHAMVVLAVATVPQWFEKPPRQTARPVTVDVVRLAEITQANRGEKPRPKPEKKPDSDQDTTRDQVARDQTARPKIAPSPEPDDQKSAEQEYVPVDTDIAPPEPDDQRRVEQNPAPETPAASKPVESKPDADDRQRVEIDPRALERSNPAGPDPGKPVKKKLQPDTQKAEEPEKSDRPKITSKPRLRPRFVKKPDTERRPKTQVAAKPKPKRAEAENTLASVLKSVGQMKQTARRESDKNRTAARKPKGQKSATRSRPMTLSEIDAVRQQIKPCWNFPTGARNAEALRVLIRVWLNRDGTVNKTQVLDRDRMSSDDYFRAAAEAGRRAIENPRCSPLQLPMDKYDQWKFLEIDFDPSKLSTG
ncbi:MAG: cell envelope integrity protein TolA [Rhodospirillaceae bacterium]|nr:cell envelope integrity protein TolA [Rhodospirillaceae bacterium]MCY4238924.1 cell envelope integrity protein TolA [Rhodospirillaceae bacterium]